MFGWAEFAPIRIAVVEPSSKSVLTARRLAAIATHVVVNKVRDETDIAMVLQATSLPLLATIPYDEGVVCAEQLGIAPIDCAPESAAIRAMSALASQLQEIM
jgi:CO dehydrogenase nickel-insertion accessory protein CooC1